MNELEEQLTPSQMEAKKKLELSCNEFLKNLLKKMSLSGGIDMGNAFVTLQMLSIQMECVTQIMVDKDPAFREELWSKMTAMFDKAASDIMKGIIAGPQPIRQQ